MIIKITKKQLEQILGVWRLSPHASPDGVTFKEPRCADCWCTIQKVHTHDERAEKILQEILKFS